MRSFARVALVMSLAGCGGVGNNGTTTNGSGDTGGSGSGSASGSGSSGSASGSGSGSGTASSSGGDDGGVIPVTPTSTTVCTVASKGTSGTLITGTLLLPAGPTTGELLISAAGTITCAAASCSTATGYAAATHIACPNGVISPSLINMHDHTEYATVSPQKLGTTRYECRNEWRTGADGATALPDVPSTTDASTIAAQELRFVMGGATSVLGSGGVGGLLRNLADYDSPTFLEGLTGNTVYFDTFPLGDSNGTVLTSGCTYPSIIKASSAFEDGVFAPHISEGINAAAQNEFTCASQSTNNLITSKTAILHGIGLTAADVATVGTAGANLVWAPRSNIDLYGDTAQVTVYRANGVSISLGTDWLASGSMNMLRELSCADTFNTNYLHGAFSDQELWEMVTANSAVAAGFDSQIGSLVAGKVADVAIFDGTTNKSYRAVIAAGTEDVRLVLRGGKVLYGDTPLVQALDTTCTAMTVCNLDRQVCLDTPSLTLAQIQTAATNIYPLFFCKGTAPTSEPSCTPYRSTYESGITATDSDGDGVADASDDCPTMFNPARPLDNGKQADADGDGYGDVCDAKPLDATAH